MEKTTTSSRAKILIVFGTRPEAVKLAPVCRALSQRSSAFEVKVCVTAQHREILDQVLELFEIVPDRDLDLMRPNQSLAALTSRVVRGVDEVLQDLSPSLVIVQGDTTTTMATALAAFYRGIPVAHVEAGLRTGRMDSPFPEELNRRTTALLADWHYAPTDKARGNLLEEGFDPGCVLVTGNTVVDALQTTVRRIGDFDPFKALDIRPDPSRPLLLMTTHRRESFDGGIARICDAVLRVLERHDVELVFPVHPNPNVRGPVEDRLGGHSRVHLVEPLDYVTFVALLHRCHHVLTDSGGVQEEAPSLGKPVLILRETTERPENVEAGGALLVGTDEEKIVREVSRLLEDRERYQSLSEARNPYGDGRAAYYIADHLEKVFAHATPEFTVECTP